MTLAYDLLHGALIAVGFLSVVILLTAFIYGVLWLLDWSDARWPQGTTDERFVLDSVARPDWSDRPHEVTPAEARAVQDRRGEHEERVGRAVRR